MRTSTLGIEKYTREVYVPSLDASKSVHTKSIQAVRQLRIWLGVDPPLATITDDLLARFADHGRAKGKAENTVKRLDSVLRRIMVHASPGSVTPCKIGNPPKKTFPSYYPKGEPAADTLQGLFRDKIVPKLHAEGKDNAVRVYSQACRNFAMFKGEFTPLADISFEDIDAFQVWSAKEGFSGTTTEANVKHLRMILRRLDPERFSQNDKPAGFEGPPPEGSLRHLFEERYRPLRLFDAEKLTIGHYVHTLRLFRDLLDREPMIEDLTNMNLAALMQTLLAEELSHVTVNHHLAHLKTLWRFAHEEGTVNDLPRMRKLKIHKREPDAWSREEFGRILQAASEEKGTIGDIPARDYWPALLLVAYYTAIRRRTLFGLEWTDIEFETGVLTVRPQLMKNRRGKRIKLPESVLEALKRIEKPVRQFIFQTPWKDDASLYRKMDVILIRAGLPTGKRQKLHKVRRTTATLVAAHSGIHAAMAMLGHSEAYVTERYIDTTKMPDYQAMTFVPEPIMPE